MARSMAGSVVERMHARVTERRASRASLRRGEFLAGLSASFALAGCAGVEVQPLVSQRPFTRNGIGKRIVVIGAGAAGITCAYRLHQAGVASEVFDANTRAGGRTWTLRGFFKDGQIAEHGGQLIASTHHSVRRLAAELGLELIDLNALYPRNSVDTYFIAGARYTHAQAVDDYDRYVYDPLSEAAKAAGYPTTFYRHTPAGVTLDRTNVDEWLNANVEGGARSKIGTLLRLACLSEYGAEPYAQSALNLIYLFAGMREGKLNLSGTGEDDKYTIRGGNDQLVASMMARLPQGSVTLGYALEALARNSDGSYTCTFSAGGTTKTMRANTVVLAMPFTVLRFVDTTMAKFSARKRRAIAALDLGTNAKIHLQFTGPYWFNEGYSGTAYADDSFQDAWDTSIGQRGRAGMLVCFPGGREGERYRGPVHGPAPRETARLYLRSLEGALPGAAAAYDGRSYQDFWSGDPLTRGAYSYYKVGQYTTLAGEERVSEGNVHFCGEQTSLNWQGYINGAVESGERVAREILSRHAGLLEV